MNIRACIKIFGMAAIVLAMAGSAQAASFTGSYAQDFDSMGTSGTTPPAGWRMLIGNSGTSHSTWVRSIAANGSNSVASMVAASTPLSVSTSPTSTSSRGYNAAASASNTSDRVLATSPTGVSGFAIELSLTNNTGSAISQIMLSYDIVRLTTVSSSKLEELPGYELFYSLDGSSWTNVAALNPTTSGSTGVVVPNTLGTTSVSDAAVDLSGSWNAGSTLLLRWVDDNAEKPSPDQILGLNNVVVSATAPVPVPAAAWLLGSGLMGLAGLRRRKA